MFQGVISLESETKIQTRLVTSLFFWQLEFSRASYTNERTTFASFVRPVSYTPELGIVSWGYSHLQMATKFLTTVRTKVKTILPRKKKIEDVYEITDTIGR